VSSQLNSRQVNLKPVVPGHVLILPIRVVARFKDLSSEEVCDLWLTAQRVGGRLEKYYSAQAMSFIIQDGPGSGTLWRCLYYYSNVLDLDLN
jgi:bis(5'-adenosyl)-triphosphatase